MSVFSHEILFGWCCNFEMNLSLQPYSYIQKLRVNNQQRRNASDFFNIFPRQEYTILVWNERSLNGNGMGEICKHNLWCVKTRLRLKIFPIIACRRPKHSQTMIVWIRERIYKTLHQYYKPEVWNLCFIKLWFFTHSDIDFFVKQQISLKL